MATNKKAVQAKADAKRAGTRARAWWGIVYEESAPENWRSLIAESLVEALISPYHDKDVLPTGELKKPHWHVLISFRNPCTRKKAAELMKSWGCVIQEHQPRPGEPEKFKVNDFRQAARYLCHLDQPDKYQYNTMDVQSVGSINYQELIMTSADEDAILDEIEEFIDTYRIVSYKTFCKIVRTYHPEWKFVLRRKFSFHIREYIKSNNWDIQNEDWVNYIEDWEGAVRSGVEKHHERTDYDSPSRSSQFQEPRMAKNDTLPAQTGQNFHPHEERKNGFIPTLSPRSVDVFYCPECCSIEVVKDGKTAGGTQRFKCKDCGKKFVLSDFLTCS